MYKTIQNCRVCGSSSLAVVLDLGTQALTGVFPKSVDEELISGPLRLVKCTGRDGCGLLQLAHTYPSAAMYGENYGYRSGLNNSMVRHLKEKVEKIERLNLIQPGDVVLDIGSNDGTTLAQYQTKCTLVGIDPTASKFANYYPPGAMVVPSFFSTDEFRRTVSNRSAKVVTSFSMFYDLDDPLSFVKQVAEIMDDNGIWVFEQSYMPAMLRTNSYDTVCHEHLEYYALAQIKWLLEKVNMKIIDVELNDVNGGSFSVTAQKATGKLSVNSSVSKILEQEEAFDLHSLATYELFKERVESLRSGLLTFLETARSDGKRVAALGASTKGNVLLQHCGVSPELIYAIGEVNTDKFGSFTPGTGIPIVDEAEIIRDKPDYVLVLPWHFRKSFDAQARYNGLNLVYPLPTISIRAAVA